MGGLNKKKFREHEWKCHGSMPILISENKMRTKMKTFSVLFLG